jgi:hypothetical protein
MKGGNRFARVSVNPVIVLIRRFRQDASLVTEFGNREAAEAQWRQHSGRRQAHPGPAGRIPGEA